MKISIGGMIASGKSTLASKISEYLNLPLVEEFEDDDVVFHQILEWLYTGKHDVELLLQVFFITRHYESEKKFDGKFVVDRDLVEHWIFANENLKGQPEIMNVYNGIFHSMINLIKKPDLYIILDLNWENFKERILSRGRDQEVKNFDKNELYFKNLLENYVSRMISMCQMYSIPYVIVDTNGKTGDEVFADSKKHLNKIKRA